jgi:CheY-like chemotaxis protein
VTDATSGTRRILVADDDLDTVESMAMMLRELGHEVLMETRAAQILHTAQAARPHIILMDIGMPDMDGWQVARLLRARLKDDTVRIVAVTGRAEREDYLRSRQAGFDAHLAKPVDLALVQSMLAQFR